MVIKSRELATTTNLLSFVYSAVHVCKKTTKLAHEKMYWSHDCCLGDMCSKMLCHLPFFIYLLSSQLTKQTCLYYVRIQKKNISSDFCFFPFFFNSRNTEQFPVVLFIFFFFLWLGGKNGVRRQSGSVSAVSIAHPLLARIRGTRAASLMTCTKHGSSCRQEATSAAEHKPSSRKEWTKMHADRAMMTVGLQDVTTLAPFF